MRFVCKNPVCGILGAEGGQFPPTPFAPLCSFAAANARHRPSRRQLEQLVARVASARSCSAAAAPCSDWPSAWAPPPIHRFDDLLLDVRQGLLEAQRGRHCRCGLGVGLACTVGAVSVRWGCRVPSGLLSPCLVWSREKGFGDFDCTKHRAIAPRTDVVLQGALFIMKCQPLS